VSCACAWAEQESNFHPPVKTGGIEIRKVKNHQLKQAALKLEKYKR
jgi:hypothetical protein